MQATNGLGVILEGRYYGESYPYDDSTTDHLLYHTQEQCKSSSTLHYCGRICALRRALSSLDMLNRPKAFRRLAEGV